MRIASGKVVDGKIIHEGELPEGAEVTLLAHDVEETFEVTPELKAPPRIDCAVRARRDDIG